MSLRLVFGSPEAGRPESGGSGRSAAWLAHLTGGQGVGGSNPLAPTGFDGMELLEALRFLYVFRAMRAGLRTRSAPKVNPLPDGGVTNGGEGCRRASSR